MTDDVCRYKDACKAEVEYQASRALTAVQERDEARSALTKQQEASTARTVMLLKRGLLCSACEGTGYGATYGCPACGGSGLVDLHARVDVVLRERDTATKRAEAAETDAATAREMQGMAEIERDEARELLARMTKRAEEAERDVAHAEALATSRGHERDTARARLAEVEKQLAEARASLGHGRQERDTLAERLGRVGPLVEAARAFVDAHHGTTEERDAAFNVGAMLADAEAALADAAFAIAPLDGKGPAVPLPTHRRGPALPVSEVLADAPDAPPPDPRPVGECPVSALGPLGHDVLAAWRRGEKPHPWSAAQDEEMWRRALAWCVERLGVRA